MRPPEGVGAVARNWQLEAALGVDSVQGSIGHDGQVDSNIRVSEARWLHRADSIRRDHFSAIDSCVKVANSQYFGLDYHPSLTFQFSACKAEDSGHYNRRTDVFWPSRNELGRRLTALVQLSPPTSYTGGAFGFSDCYQPPPSDGLSAQGTVSVFPSLFYHIAQPVTQGTRYSLVSWYEGQPWR